MISLKIEKIFIVIFSVLLALYCSQMIYALNETTEATSKYYGISVFLFFIAVLFYVIGNFWEILLIPLTLIRVFFFWILCVLVVHILIPTKGFNSYRIVMMLNMLIPPLAFYSVYLLFMRRDLLKMYLKISVIITIILLYVYYDQYTIANTVLVDEKDSLNSAYYPFLMMPTILCLKKKWLRLILILLISIAIFSSMKRGGLIALFLSLIVYYLTNKIFANSEGFKIKNVFYICLMMLTVWYSFVTYDKDYNDGLFTERFEKLNEDKGSGREGIYEEVFGLIQKSNTIDFIFGHGDNTVSKVTRSGYSAHNDFLEVTYSYGLMTLIVYIILHFCLIKICYGLIKQKSEFAAPFALSYTQFLVFSMISHVVVYTYFVLLTIFWAMVIGITHRESQIKTVTE